MKKTLVLNVVGLTPRMLGPHAPHLTALASAGAARPLATITPAVTCSVQSSLVTGLLPREHGIVGNGWYFRELAEVSFWRQSNHLVSGEKIWDAAKKRDPSFTCAKMFWWYNMYSSADVSVTPRPQYPADGRKLPDVYSEPASLRDELQAELGTFPLFRFWGPAADISSSEWIARASERVFVREDPTLTLVYLPHLDYNLQRLGPDDPRISEDIRQVDAVAGRLIDLAQGQGARVIVLSEYGITRVTGAVLINRALREVGLLRVRREDAGELLDAGASEAFAVVDHQVAHVYVKRPERNAEVAALLRGLDGVEAVWDGEEKRQHGLDHARSGELVAIARADRWFQYHYWTDDARAPDFARTVDIHRKPGYDPVELFLDPTQPFIKGKILWTLLKKKLGFRTLLDVIPLDPTLVKGSHGRLTDDPQDGPVFITSEPALLDAAAGIEAGGAVPATRVKDVILDHVFAA